MANQSNQATYWLMGAILILSVVSLFLIMGVRNNNQVNIDQEALANSVGKAVVTGLTPTLDELKNTMNPVSGNGSDDTPLSSQDEILRIISEDERAEDFANELFMDEIKDRDFKRFLQNIINDNLEDEGSNSEIESWRDIEDIKITDLDVDVNHDDASIKAELKVYFLLDGDDELEDMERAKLEIKLEVEDLDADEEFEDAEILDYDETNFEFVKFYNFPF